MNNDKLGGQRPPPDNSEREPSPLADLDRQPANRTRMVQILRAGPFQFGIFTDEIATTVEWRAPTPLPHAPKSVLGVVSVQGRILTVLNLATLLGSQVSSSNGSPHYILALRGDEQLALAVDRLDETVEIPNVDLNKARERAERLVPRVFKYRDAEIGILNAKELFATALQGRERRRRRF